MSNCPGITGLPDSVGKLTKLQHLDMSRCSGVKEIPESLGGLNQLQHLNLSYCDSITKLPEAIGSLNNMQYFDLQSSGQIRELPGSFQNLQNLLHLNLSGCVCAKGLAEALRGLTALEHFDMAVMRIDDLFRKDLCDAMGNLANLKYLNASGMDCSPYFIGILTNLEHLVLKGFFSMVSLPECIGNLKKLQTLELSWCTRLESLPDNIGNLQMLHTLDLSWCTNLKSLPDSIREITVLKSMLIEGCSNELIGQINSKLHYSLTLPLFKVQANVVSSTCSNLHLLEGTNVDELRINSLENVRSLEEAHQVKLLDKDRLLYLTMAWTSLDDVRFVDDEDLLGQLVPPRGLKSLRLEYYSGQSFPIWFMDITHHLPNLVSITLNNLLPKCNNLPPLGQLPNLEILSLSRCQSITKIGKDICGGKGAFRRLSGFFLHHMLELEEWCTTYRVEDGSEEFMFPVLDKLVVGECPMLRLTPCPPVCRDCTIRLSDKIISSLEEIGNNSGHLTSSTPTTTLTIHGCHWKSLRLFHHFTALQELEISTCHYLTGLPESMRHLTSLQSLKMQWWHKISALPEWLGDLCSLKSLTIKDCSGINSLPPCIQQLTKLQTLRIEEGPELKQWCELEENKKKLDQINIIYVDCDTVIQPQYSSEGNEPSGYSSEENEPTEYSSHRMRRKRRKLNESTE